MQEPSTKRLTLKQKRLVVGTGIGSPTHVAAATWGGWCTRIASSAGWRMRRALADPCQHRLNGGIGAKAARRRVLLQTRHCALPIAGLGGQ